MAPSAPRHLRSAALLAALACALAHAPLAAQQTGTPAMQQAVAALTRALQQKDFAVLSPFLDESFHIDRLTGGFARQILERAVTAGDAPTAVHVESTSRSGGMVHATTRIDWADRTRTVALVLTEAGKFVEIPLVQVHMNGMGGAPPPNAVGGLQMRMGDTPPAPSGQRHAGPPPSGAATAARPPSNPALREELLAMRQKDQELRSRIPLGQPGGGRPAIDPELRRAMLHADSENVARLKEIVAQHGWPGASMVGEDGAQAAFLVLQHADPATQEHFLPMVRDAVARHELAPGLLATLEDRVRLAHGEKQIYGTQITGSRSTGRMEVWPIEDEAHVDERRAAVGLPPMAEYVRVFGLTWPPPR
jgi:hypothetical protein